ncbi:MAG TPA: FprA family A-type flavoprotein [Lentimicrobium sp.]|nr:FprA family A-type flavoprotein [Lentimicrobium sp.]
MIDTKVLDITRDVKWIGVLDYDIITFDVVMQTKYGTTYNSYLINAEKIAVVETVKQRFRETYLNKINTLINPADIQYIILDHTEPDHSGNVETLLELAPDAVVVGSGNAIRYLREMLGHDFKSMQVKDGDTLSLGNKTLKFISAPNLHWPDSIYTYLEEDKLLFTCDSFGAHFCHEAMFDDLTGPYDDAFKYYFDVILKPYSKFMLKAIEKIKDLDIQTICTGHGPILRSTWREKIALSEKFSKEAVSDPVINRVFIPFVSAYQNTRTMAYGIAEGVRSAGNIEVHVCDIETMSFEELEEHLSKASGYIIGSPTINQNILLQIYQLFALINPIRDKGKLAGCFGSYGWSGEGAKIIESNLINLKLKVVKQPLFFKFTPHEEDLVRSYEYGREFGKAILEKSSTLQVME